MAAKMFVPLIFLGAVVSLSLANEFVDPAVCSEPMNEGIGDERNLLRFFYVPDKYHCQPFFYKGQEGNGNRFTSDRECMQNCSSKFSQLYPETEQELCNLPADHGSCMANILQYYYNAEEENCRLFHYGGCQGNGNRFKTREECQQTCMERPEDEGTSVDDVNPDDLDSKVVVEASKKAKGSSGSKTKWIRKSVKGVKGGDNTNPEKAATNPGLIVGILVGILCGVAVIAGIAFIVMQILLKKRAKRKKRKQNPDDGTELTPAMGPV